MDFRSLEDSLLQDYAQTHKPTARDRIKEIEAQVQRARVTFFFPVFHFFQTKKQQTP